jgi:hypothetical protein
MGDDRHAPARPAATPSRTDYTVAKSEVSLAVSRKHMGAPALGQPPYQTKLIAVPHRFY